jgi:hypothetical protein
MILSVSVRTDQLRTYLLGDRLTVEQLDMVKELSGERMTKGG